MEDGDGKLILRNCDCLRCQESLIFQSLLSIKDPCFPIPPCTDADDVTVPVAVRPPAAAQSETSWFSAFAWLTGSDDKKKLEQEEEAAAAEAAVMEEEERAKKVRMMDPGERLKNFTSDSSCLKSLYKEKCIQCKKNGETAAFYSCEKCSCATSCRPRCGTGYGCKPAHRCGGGCGSPCGGSASCQPPPCKDPSETYDCSPAVVPDSQRWVELCVTCRRYPCVCCSSRTEVDHCAKPKSSPENQGCACTKGCTCSNEYDYVYV